MPDASPEGGQYILYGTSACHLCEVAQEMLQLLCESRSGLSFVEVDISEDDALFERYGLRIPVLADARGSELDWPFTPQQLWDFCEGQG